MTVSCNSCQKPFADFNELALHISSQKKGHRKGKKWAAKYLMRTRQLDKKKLNNGGIGLTSEDRKNRETTIRELSGKNEMVIAHCPKCKTRKQQVLPVEYVSSSEAWHMGDKLVVICEGCRG